MDPGGCPNFTGCRLTNGHLELDASSVDKYIQVYCHSPSEKWLQCKRFVCKEQIHFCPDFVMPDSPWEVDEIIDRFENLENK